jgi:branched-chain amino acid transport system permease protein
VGVPFLPSLGAAFVAAALIGVVLERTLYVHLYRRSHLDQVLFSIGLVFMAISAVDYLMGAQQQLIRLPEWLRGQVSLLGVSIGAYRLFIIAICGMLTVVLQMILARTRFGSRLRASVDDPSVARGLGIDVDRIFTLTFAVGSGLAGLGGALGIEVLGLDPTFPIRFMIYFLIVVVVGGTTSITGPFFTSIVLGIGDIAGKYYVPELGAFVIYTMMIVILILRPQGLFTRPAR